MLATFLIVLFNDLAESSSDSTQCPREDSSKSRGRFLVRTNVELQPSACPESSAGISANPFHSLRRIGARARAEKLSPESAGRSQSKRPRRPRKHAHEGPRNAKGGQNNQTFLLLPQERKKQMDVLWVLVVAAVLTVIVFAVCLTFIEKAAAEFMAPEAPRKEFAAISPVRRARGAQSGPLNRI